MASRVQNITIDQGTDFTVSLDIYSSKSDTSKTDLGSSHYANAQMRKSYEYTNSALTFTATVDQAEDQVILSANNYQTKIKAGRYLYEVVVTYTGGSPDTKFRAVEGIATIAPAVEYGSLYTGGASGYS
jgi:hypothetical protein